jgi:hypothetical protein
VSGIDETNKKGKIPMRSDDEITREIMEASIGGLGLAAAKAAGKGAVAAGKVGANAIGATRAGGRLKGAAMATNVLTKLKRDWGTYVGAQNGVSFKSFVPSENDLLNFVNDYYGYDGKPVLATAMTSLGLTSSGQQAAAPAAEPAQAPQAAPQAAPAAGAAPKAMPAAQAAPAAPQQAQQPQAQAQAAAAPQAAPAAAQPAAPADNVIKREKPFYKHNSSFIDFDDPDLADPTTNPWSSKRARDEAKNGNDNPAMAGQRKPPKKSRRNESIEPTDLSFSEIIAEAETASVNSQAVRSKQASKAMADEFLKGLARQIASKPVEYRAFMSGQKTELAQAGSEAHAYTAGPKSWTNPKPNATDAIHIDRKAINAILTGQLHIHPQRMEEIKQEVKGLNPEQTFEKLRQVVKQDEALKIVAALLKTLETP